MKNIKGKVFYTLVNYESNKALAEEIPHVKIHGLMMVFQYILKNTSRELSARLVTDKDLAKWEITKDQLLLEAKETLCAGTSADRFTFNRKKVAGLQFNYYKWSKWCSSIVLR